MLFMSCVYHAFVSAHRCLVVVYWEWTDLLALVFAVLLCLMFYWYPGSGVLVNCIES